MVFRLGVHSFEFQTHSDRGSNFHVSINVKAYNVYSAKLSKKLTKQYDALSTEDQEELHRWAWDDVSEEFWTWAHERATELGLGQIWSEGRSGGHLVLERYSVERLEELALAYESECELCHREWETHANQQCLFQSTKWHSINHSCLEAFEEIRQFFKEVEECKEGWPEYYLDRLEYLI